MKMYYDSPSHLTSTIYIADTQILANGHDYSLIFNYNGYVVQQMCKLRYVLE